MKHLYKILTLFLLAAVAIPAVGYAQSDTIIVRNITYTTVCDSYEWNGTEYTVSGNYEYSITVDDTTYVDSLYLTIKHPVHKALTATACETYTWTREDATTQTYTASGEYTYSHEDANGCTQVDTLHLTINHVSEGIDEQVACESFTWIDDSTYTSSTTTPTFTLTNAAGCDSVVTLRLTIHHSTHNTYSASACGSYSWHDTTYTTSDTYTYGYTNADGCPSVDTLHLTINNPVHTAIYVTECESYTWTDGTGDTYTASGTYLNPHQDANGCTQVDTLHLTVHSPATENLEATICANDLPYNYVNGDIDTTFEVGTPNFSVFSFQFSTSHGCDSVVTLHLTINNPVHESITRSECESYVWHDSIYTQSGNHFYIHPDANGCTQVDTLHLTIYHPAHKDTVVTACESFTWHGAAYTTSGIYTFAHQDEHYCWQVDTLHLTILSAYNTSIEETICQNELPFHYINGQIDTTFELGTPSRQTVLFVLTSSIGIDSVIALTLIVNPTPTPIIMGETTICEGESSTLTAIGGAEYSWNDNTTSYRLTVSESGTYTVTATSTENCSATASVTVTVNPLPTVVISGENSFCAGESTTLTASGASTYIWNTTETTADIEVTRAGTYIVTGTDINGCSKSASQEIVMNVLPTIVISGENSFCAGESEDLTASGASTYIWNTTEGTPSITVNAAGSYSVTGTDVNHCSNTASFEVAVNALPTIVISGENSFCAGESTDLTASGASTYIWNTTEDMPSITVNAAGTYSVTGTDVNGCVNTTTTEVSANPLPSVVISGENSFCAGESTTLTASGALTYIWNTAESTADITVNHSGTYSVVGTDASGCANTASIEVTENPTYSIYIDTFICANNLPYHYVNGAIDTTFEVGTTQFSTFNFQLLTSHGCDSIVNLTLTIYPQPVSIISGESEICEGDSSTLTATGGDHYLWSTGDTTNQIQAVEEGAYTVTATNQWGCMASADFTVSYRSVSTPRLDIVSKNRADGTPYMLVYPQADLQYQWLKDDVPLDGETKQYYCPESGLGQESVYSIWVRPFVGDACTVRSEWTYTEGTKGKVSVVPNPNNGQFTLYLPYEAQRVQIFSTNGQLLFDSGASVGTQLRLNTGLSTGLYILKIVNEAGEIHTEKLLINK